jgi:hypothetical protein
MDDTIDGADKGIIPLTCEELFRRVDDKKGSDPNVDFRVEVSYIEVSKHFLRLTIVTAPKRERLIYFRRFIMRKFETFLIQRIPVT